MVDTCYERQWWYQAGFLVELMFVRNAKVLKCVGCKGPCVWLLIPYSLIYWKNSVYLVKK